MTRRINTIVALGLAIGLAGASVGAVRACGFDGILLNGFEALHPKSIDVSIAIRAAYDAGIVDKSTIEPITPGSAGYWRAVGHLSGLQRALAFDESIVDAPAISVLLVDSSLWSRITPDGRSGGLQVHTVGAQPNDVVVITNEAILVAILERRLSPERALDQGLLRVEGDELMAGLVRRAVLRAALTAERESANIPPRAAPFFNAKKP